MKLIQLFSGKLIFLIGNDAVLLGVLKNLNDTWRTSFFETKEY